MKLGLSSYAYAWSAGVPGSEPKRPMSVFNLLHTAHRLDVRLVQVCENMPFAHLPESEIARLADEAGEAGIEVQLGTRGLKPENLLHHLGLVQRLGGWFLRVVIDKGSDEPAPDEAIKRLHAVLPEFADAGVLVAIENHDRFPVRMLSEIIERLGPDRVGVTLDTVNSFATMEGPREVVPALAPFTICLHVKDFTIRRPPHNMGFVLEGCPAGQGRLDMPWMLEQLQVSPHPFDCILETWVTPSESMAETVAREQRWTEDGVRFLRKLIPA